MALVNDLKQACRLALEAERRIQGARVHDAIDELVVLASLRRLERKGLIRISGKLAIASNARRPTVIILTPTTLERLLER